MADFSPRGYKNPDTPSEINDPAFWATVGKNQDARWLEIKEDSEGALANSTEALATLGAVKQEAAAATAAAQQSASSSVAAQNAATDAADTAELFGDDVELLKQMAQIDPGSVTDAQTALLVQDPVSETNARVITQAIEATAIRTDRGFMTLQAAVDACQPGDTLQIRKEWAIAEPITVSKAVTIQSVRGGVVATTTDVHAFNVIVSGVTFDGVALTGAGSATAGSQAAIRAVGTVAAPITGLTVRNCSISGFRKYGIEGEHVHDFIIEWNRIESIAYGGVMLTSPLRGEVGHNTIRNIVQPAGFTNSYGIAATRNSTQTLAASPRATSVQIYNNRVDGVPGWEGIDTHGGEDILIKENTVHNCNVGIALVPGVDAVGVDAYAPKRIKVLNNTVTSGVTDGTRSIGIQLVGCTNGVDSVIEYADAVIQGNTVDGHGRQNLANTGAIFMQATIGTVVNNNVITEAGLNAIHATHNNKSLAVDNNTAVDTWTSSMAYTSVLRVSSHYNTVKAAGNGAVRANKSAALVNNRGLFAAGGLSGTTVQWGDNDMSVTTSEIIDGGLSFSRMSATKMAFSPTATPVTRPALRAAATDEPTSRALVNQIRLALIGYGLTS